MEVLSPNVDQRANVIARTGHHKGQTHIYLMDSAFVFGAIALHAAVVAPMHRAQQAESGRSLPNRELRCHCPARASTITDAEGAPHRPSLTRQDPEHHKVIEREAA